MKTGNSISNVYQNGNGKTVMFLFPFIYTDKMGNQAWWSSGKWEHANKSRIVVARLLKNVAV